MKFKNFPANFKHLKLSAPFSEEERLFFAACISCSYTKNESVELAKHVLKTKSLQGLVRASGSKISGLHHWLISVVPSMHTEDLDYFIETLDYIYPVSLGKTDPWNSFVMSTNQVLAVTAIVKIVSYETNIHLLKEWVKALGPDPAILKSLLRVSKTIQDLEAIRKSSIDWFRTNVAEIAYKACEINVSEPDEYFDFRHKLGQISSDQLSSALRVITSFNRDSAFKTSSDKFMNLILTYRDDREKKLTEIKKKISSPADYIYLITRGQKFDIEFSLCIIDLFLETSPSGQTMEAFYVELKKDASKQHFIEKALDKNELLESLMHLYTFRRRHDDYLQTLFPALVAGIEKQHHILGLLVSPDLDEKTEKKLLLKVTKIYSGLEWMKLLHHKNLNMQILAAKSIGVYMRRMSFAALYELCSQTNEQNVFMQGIKALADKAESMNELKMVINLAPFDGEAHDIATEKLSDLLK